MNNAHNAAGQNARDDRSWWSRRGIWLQAALVVIVTALVLAIAPAANLLRVAGAPAGFWLVVIGGPALLALIAVRASRSCAGDDHAALTPLAVALGGAGLASVIDRVYALGFDGLAMPLALMAGLALSLILLAPSHQSGADRAAGEVDVADAIAGAVLTIVLVVLLASELRILWRASAGLLQAGFGIVALVAGALAAGVVTALVVLTTLVIAASRWGQSVATWMLWAAALAILVTIAWLAFASGHGFFAHGAFGQAISGLAERETALIKRGLSDFEQLKPMASPFLKVSLLDTLGAVAAIAFGIAAISLMSRQLAAYSGDGVSRGHRPSTLTGWTLAAAALLVSGLAGLVVFARIGLADAIAAGIAVSELPSGIDTAYRLGWLNICGAAWPVDVEAACAAREAAGGPLRLHDLAFGTDGFVLAAPLIGGLPLHAALLYWIGLGVAAAAATVVVCRLAIAMWARIAGLRQQESQRLPVAIVGLMVVAAGLVAIWASASVADTFEYALALSAAGLLAAGLLSLRCEPPSAAGRITAIVTGLALFLAYVLAIGHMPADVVSAAGLVSADDIDGIETFETFEALKAAVADAASPAARAAAIAARDAYARDLLSYGIPRPATAVLLAVPVAWFAGWLVTVLTAGHQRRAVST